MGEWLAEIADVLILDLNLPDNLAIQIAEGVKASGLGTRVLILVPDDHKSVVECIAAGAHGCVLERSSLQDLDTAIRRVLSGEMFCSPEIMESVFSELSRIGKIQAKQPKVPKAAMLDHT